MKHAIRVVIALAAALSLLGCGLMSIPTEESPSEDLILSTAVSHFVSGRRWNSTTLCVEATNHPHSSALANRLRSMHPSVIIKSGSECEFDGSIPYDRQSGKPCAALSARLVEKSATHAKVRIGYVACGGGSEQELAKLVFEGGVWKITEVIEGAIP